MLLVPLLFVNVLRVPATITFTLYFLLTIPTWYVVQSRISIVSVQWLTYQEFGLEIFNNIVISCFISSEKMVMRCDVNQSCTNDFNRLLLKL
jgi:hypothetical protein